MAPLQCSVSKQQVCDRTASRVRYSLLSSSGAWAAAPSKQASLELQHVRSDQHRCDEGYEDAHYRYMDVHL